MHLTPRQQQILTLIEQRQATDEPAPTLDELCAALGLRSRGSLHKHIQALVAAGHLEPARGRHRGLQTPAELCSDAPDADLLPLLGRIAAGRPIEAVADPEQVEVPARLRGNGPCYVLRVVGDSMSGAGILDGDEVVIEQRDQANNGDIVVALIRGEEATLKRIDQRPGEVLLLSANDEIAAQRYRPDEIQIQGVLVGQMRAYR